MQILEQFKILAIFYIGATVLAKTSGLAVGLLCQDLFFGVSMSSIVTIIIMVISRILWP